MELFQQSDKENSTALSTEAVAHAYQQAGQLDQAIATFQKMLSFPGGSLSWEPQQRWLIARYTLATDYSSRGDNQKARHPVHSFDSLEKRRSRSAHPSSRQVRLRQAAVTNSPRIDEMRP
jgi:Tfp pilus assembly protein PilF